MRPTVRRVVLYKRWRLRDGVSHEQIADVVANRIAPHYRRLSADVRLCLEAPDEAHVLAIQRWPSRGQLEAAMGGARFEAWWREYQPILVAWDALLEFDEEWETEVLLG